MVRWTPLDVEMLSACNVQKTGPRTSSARAASFSKTGKPGTDGTFPNTQTGGWPRSRWSFPTTLRVAPVPRLWGPGKENGSWPAHPPRRITLSHGELCPCSSPHRGEWVSGSEPAWSAVKKTKESTIAFSHLLPTRIALTTQSMNALRPRSPLKIC